MVPLIRPPFNWAKFFRIFWGRIKRGPLYINIFNLKMIPLSSALKYCYYLILLPRYHHPHAVLLLDPSCHVLDYTRDLLASEASHVHLCWAAISILFVTSRKKNLYTIANILHQEKLQLFQTIYCFNITFNGLPSPCPISPLHFSIDWSRLASAVSQSLTHPPLSTVTTPSLLVPEHQQFSDQ